VMNPDWAFATLEAALKTKGVVLGAASIKRHRLGLCSCWKI